MIFILALAVSGCHSSAETPGDSKEAPEVKPHKAEPQKLLEAAIPARVLPALGPSAAGDWFELVTGKSGVDFTYRNGMESKFYTLLETVGGGVAMLDYDRDGDLDLYFTGGGRIAGPPMAIQGLPCALYRNDGEWRFTEVTAAAGLTDPEFYTHGCFAGDFDRDGFPDLFVTGFQGLRLYRNLQDGRFADVTQSAGLNSTGWSTAAAWVDVDRDGWLDLYVACYSVWTPADQRICVQEHETGPIRDACAPTSFEGQRDQLWRNRGDGTFEDITLSAGIADNYRGLGVVAADYDDDGWTDLFVANDVNENDLYFGGSHFPWRSEGVAAGVAFSPEGEREGSMGADVGDYDGDGRPDLFYTNYAGQDNALHRNEGQRGFRNVTGICGLGGVSRRWVGFGTALADFDSDGWPDIVVANGHVLYAAVDAPYFQPAQLFRNEAGRRFAEVSAQGGPYFGVPRAGRGLAVGDLDNDGALDIVFVHQNEPVELLRNRRPPEHWLRVELRGVSANPDAVGAKVMMPYRGRTLANWVRGGCGYLSHFDSRVLFPLADATPAAVTVRWPGGAVESFDDLAPNRTHVLVEGRGRRE